MMLSWGGGVLRGLLVLPMADTRGKGSGMFVQHTGCSYSVCRGGDCGGGGGGVKVCQGACGLTTYTGASGKRHSRWCWSSCALHGRLGPARATLEH
jgi:hypothetical protein